MSDFYIRRLRLIFLLYFVMLTVFSIRHNSEPWIIIMQFLMSVEFMVAFFSLYRSNIVNIVLSTGILLLINILLVRFLFDIYNIPVFGPDAADSMTYMTMSLSTKKFSWSSFISYLNSYGFSIDDYGMLIIGHLIAIWGDTSSDYITMLSFINVLVIMMSTVYMYRAGLLILRKETCSLIALLWGLNQVFLAFTIWGLKENFFLLVVVLAIYYLLKYLSRHSISSLICGTIFILLSLLFRFAVGAQLLLALLISFLLPKVQRHKMLTISLLFVVFLLLLVNLDILINSVGGNEGLEGFYQLAKNNSGMSVTVNYVIQILYSIIGSPANFTDSINFNHLITLSSLVYSFISILFIFGLLVIWKVGNKTTFFLFFYWALGAGMLMLALRGNDVRFASLYLPAFLLIAATGYENRNIIFPKHSKFIATAMTLIILSITFIWNR